MNDAKHKWSTTRGIDASPAERDALLAHIDKLEAEDDRWCAIHNDQLRQIARLNTENKRLEAELDRAWKKYEEARKDRAAVLDVDTTDGLSSSEWLLRTALAEKRVKKLEAEKKRLRSVAEMVLELATVFFPPELVRAAQDALSQERE